MRGIGAASLLADLGHEVPTALLPSLLTSTLGAIGGPLLALGLVAAFGVRTAILLSIIPGLLAALAIVYAIGRLPRLSVRERRPLRLRIRPLLRGHLGELLLGVGAFELGNVAATLLILRATDLLSPEHGSDAAVKIALGLYAGYNLAARAGRRCGNVRDRLRTAGRERAEHRTAGRGVRDRRRRDRLCRDGRARRRGGSCAGTRSRVGVRAAGGLEKRRQPGRQRRRGRPLDAGLTRGGVSYAAGWMLLAVAVLGRAVRR